MTLPIILIIIAFATGFEAGRQKARKSIKKLLIELNEIKKVLKEKE